MNTEINDEKHKMCTRRSISFTFVLWLLQPTTVTHTEEHECRNQ